MDRKIYILGETTCDIIFEYNRPVDIQVGGSQLNTSVSLGRLNMPVAFVSQLGNDRLGELAIQFLNSNGVSTEFIYRHNYATRLSLAFLDDNKDASYSFYDIGKSNQLIFPQVTPKDVILFGSSFALREDIRDALRDFLIGANQKGALVIYDPNFREAYLPRLDKLKPYIEENINLSTIIRGSDEDFYSIFNLHNPAEIYNKIIGQGSKTLIITKNRSGVDLLMSGYTKHVDVPIIKPVNTIGAGDAFNAAIIFCHCITKNTNDMFFWDQLIETSITFSQHTCMSMENYISSEFALNYKDDDLSKILEK